MKICISALLVSTAPGKRLAGVGRHMIKTLDQLAVTDLGHTFHVFLPADVELPDHWARSKWITWHRVDTSRVYKRVWWEHFKVGIEAKRLGCDLLFALFIQLPILCRLPKVTVVHDAFPRTHGEWFPPKQRKILDTLTQDACRRSVVMTVSEFSKSELVRAYGADPDRIVVAYNGLGNSITRLSESEIAAAQLDQFHIPPGRRIFVVSTLEPRKNMDGLIRAFKLLRKKEELSDVQLVIAGAKGWMDSAIAAEVGDDPAGAGIHFLGYVTDLQLNALMQTCTVCACVSHVEGFGIPVLEAMAAGAPVVCSQTSSLPEVGGDCVQYCQPASPESICDALSSVLGDHARLNRMRQCGLARAQEFSWERMVIGLKHAFDLSIRSGLNKK